MSGPISATSTDIIPAVLGSNSGSGIGLWGLSDSGNAIVGSSNSGAGIIGESNSGNAGDFRGNVVVTGHLTASGTVTASDVLVSGADCAEEFDVACDACVEPGTVVVIDADGCIDQTTEAYNKRVAGVISGAGRYRPAVILVHEPSSSVHRARVALLGRVYCKVDASYAPIAIGDMLTTSPTPGCAMRAGDPSRAFGATIGKALQSLGAGQSLIPILIALQ
jgi:hypothetical protein